jgi:hypothetical protein
MSEMNFNDFAKRVILALKEIEYDLDDCTLPIEEWSLFLREELDGEAEEEEEEEDYEEAMFLRAAENIIDADSLTYDTLEKLWEDKE